MNEKIINYIKTLSNDEKEQELLVKTIGNILLKQDNIENFIQKNNEKIIHICDWINSVVKNNEQWKKPRVLTLESLNNAADKYFQKKINKLKIIELDETHEKLIADLGDFYIVQMLTPQALDNESRQMQHCIGHGGYDKRLTNKYFQYLSLRDKFNKAHVTLEIYNKQILQLQGKQNNIPETKYSKILLPWLINNNYTFKKLSTFVDKENLSITAFEDVILEKKDFKTKIDLFNGVVVSYGSDKFLFKKRYNLIINNKKFIVEDDKSKYLTEIPFNPFKKQKKERIYKIKNIVNFLFKNGYKNIPYADLEYIANKKDNKIYSISNIPENCEIDDNVDLLHKHRDHSFLDNLFFKFLFPDNLIINGEFKVEEFHKFKKLPKNLVINDNFSLSYSKLNDINNITFNKNITIDSSNIYKFPENFIVNGDFIMSCSNVCLTSKKMIVHGNCIFNSLSHFIFPNETIINGDLDLSNFYIKNLPNGMKINGNLILYNMKIKEIAEDLECQNLYIDECHISLIKETMNFKKIYIRDDKEYEYTKQDFFEKFGKDIEDEINIKL